jgi:outer membrane protein, multidrug efflux system
MTAVRITMRLIAAIAGIGIALGALAMTGGCAPRQGTKRQPAITPPAAFRGATAAVTGGAAAAPAPGAAADVTSLADLKWFEVFKDERLHELIRTALVRNYDLREAVVRVETARAALGITRADQFPTIEAGVGITTSRSAASGSFPLPAGVDQTRTFGTVTASLLSFELDVWGRLRRATEAARADLLASEENRKAVTTTLVSDVASAYFTLLELDMELEIAKRTLAVRQDSLVLIRNRERGGLGTLLDVRQGEQLVEAAEQVIPSIEQLIAQTENQIALLIGDSPGPVLRGRPLTSQEPLPEVPSGVPSALLTRRPDIRAAEQTLASTSALIDVARAAYLPRISLTGLLGFQSDQLSGLFTGPARVWQFVPQVTQPVFNGGRLRSNVQLAKAQEEIALIQYERTIQTAFREVSDALVQYEKVREIRTKQESLVATLRDRSRLSYVRYEGGIDTLLSALDADRDLFDAELGLAQVRRNELLTLVQLYRALGGGWQS